MITFSKYYHNVFYRIFLIYWVQTVGIVTQLNQNSELFQIALAILTLVLVCYIGGKLIFDDYEEEEKDEKEN